jgi:hypothetical protein
MGFVQNMKKYVALENFPHNMCEVADTGGCFKET